MIVSRSLHVEEDRGAFAHSPAFPRMAPDGHTRLDQATHSTAYRLPRVEALLPDSGRQDGCLARGAPSSGHLDDPQWHMRAPIVART